MTIKNLNDDNTNRRDKAFHAGLPPNTGEKWMSNKWIRMNPHTSVTRLSISSYFVPSLIISEHRVIVNNRYNFGSI